ncbi:MAG: hypothetical protein IPH20_14295 [Bacteroidales bacterium]|nr:hypothetical protein [Bacteroidales bacterium]
MVVKEIEEKLKCPMDIEWCIDSISNRLFILQCRPITTIFPSIPGIIPINLLNRENIPIQGRDFDKVRIRFIAQENFINISNAYIIVNSKDFFIDDALLRKIHPDKSCKGYSVVLIYPKRISGNIIRYFADNEIANQKSSFRTCQRYEVRTYQDKQSLKDTLQTIYYKCNEVSWLCIVIIQEIFDPVFTGIAKKIEGGYLLEIAKGHFVPKGIVPTSQYILSDDYGILHKKEVTQEYSYNISQGAVIKENCNSFISIDSISLSLIIKKLSPVLSTGNQAVEFGLLLDEESNLLMPYLIDMVNDQSNNELDSKLLTEGVISAGKRTGGQFILNQKIWNRIV